MLKIDRLDSELVFHQLSLTFSAQPMGVFN